MRQTIGHVTMWTAAALMAQVSLSNVAQARGLPDAKSPSIAGQATDSVAPAVLGADDVIEISVMNHPDLNRVATILGDGTILVPEVGEIVAAGKTPLELAAQIRTALEKTRNNVIVTVSVKEIHSRRVRALGAVRTQGSFDLKRRWRLVDLVVAAGGLSGKPSMTSARIVRDGTRIVPIDIAQALKVPEGDANVLLVPDDLVLFDELPVPGRTQAHAIGQVTKPGFYDIDPDTTVLTLLSQAGGQTTTAALTRAYVLRGDTRLPVNLRPTLVEGKADDAVTRFKIQSGDVLFIPENEEHYAVMGQVGKPGFYPLPERGEVTILEALNFAGGQGGGGDLARAGIIRPTDGKATVLPVNIAQILKKGNLAENVALHSGDILYIPEKNAKHGFGWQDVLTPLTALSFLGFRIGR